ncbi:alpha/beta family hydrolase [Lutimaribacter saemankumensis]
MGGRVASMIEDELFETGRISGLLCVGYPFHPIGRPEKLRTEHLLKLRTPTLIWARSCRSLRSCRVAVMPTKQTEAASTLLFRCIRLRLMSFSTREASFRSETEPDRAVGPRSTPSDHPSQRRQPRLSDPKPKWCEFLCVRRKTHEGYFSVRRTV